jgi:membrane-bound lytic murein transglycosylase D
VEVPSPVRLLDLAKQSDLRVEDIREFNPHLLHERTPRHVSRYEVWFPKENAAKITGHLAQLKILTSSQHVISRQVAKNEAIANRVNYHRVKAGENLTLIAQRYGISVSFLLKVNSIRSSKRLYPGMELRLTSRAYHPQKIIRYRVKQGESLERISRRFGLSINKLKSDNSLESDRIYPRQVLMIRRNGT